MATTPSSTGAREGSDPSGKDEGIASQAMDKMQEQTTNLRAQAQEKARAQLEGRSTQLGDQAESVAHAFRTTAEQLESDGNTAAARAARTAAGQAERVGRYLRDADADRFLGDVESFARRRPWLTAGMGAFLGFAASRFVKASSERRYESERSMREDADLPLARGRYDEELPAPETFHAGAEHARGSL